MVSNSSVISAYLYFLLPTLQKVDEMINSCKTASWSLQQSTGSHRADKDHLFWTIYETNCSMGFGLSDLRFSLSRNQQQFPRFFWHPGLVTPSILTMQRAVSGGVVVWWCVVSPGLVCYLMTNSDNLYNINPQCWTVWWQGYGKKCFVSFINQTKCITLPFPPHSCLVLVNIFFEASFNRDNHDI